jgi:hypothetical protein
MTTCPVSGLNIIVRDSVVVIVRTGSAGGPLGLALLFMCMGPDHESPKLKWCAATKAACSAVVPILPWMSSSLGIQ